MNSQYFPELNRRRRPLLVASDRFQPGTFDNRSSAGNQALCEIDQLSRRIDILARELNVLGYFDEEPDRPRAA